MNGFSHIRNLLFLSGFRHADGSLLVHADQAFQPIRHNVIVVFFELLHGGGERHRVNSERVRDLATERKLSIYKISQMSEISYSTFRTAEQRNGELSVAAIMRVCAALGITVAEFFSVFTD